MYADEFISRESPVDKKQWYVLQTKPKKEKIVYAQLQNSFNYDVFFPQIHNYRSIRPLFPSYLFVNAFISSFHDYRVLQYTKGVLRLLGTRNGGPVSISQEVIVTIKNQLGKDGFIDQRRFFRAGQTVRIIKGPLKDLIGILERPATDQERVQVLFKCLRYPLRATLRFENLDLVRI